MKTLQISILAILLFAVYSCSDDSNRVGTDAKEGGLLESYTPVITHIQSATDIYTIRLKVYQGAVRTTKVDIYKQFKGEIGSSEAVLHSSIEIPNTDNTNFYTSSFTFPQLKEGLTVNGAALPSDDDLKVGDKIVLSYRSHTSTGLVSHQQAALQTEIAISGRFAGIYQVVESNYYRIGTQSGAADWVGVKRVIKSIDSETYQHVGWGPWSTDNNGPYSHQKAFLYFSIGSDADNLPISYYKEYGGAAITGLGDAMVTCAEDVSAFTNISCANSNRAVKDDVEGKDRLIMTYGYNVTTGDASGQGYREFYEVLEKIK